MINVNEIASVATSAAKNAGRIIIDQSSKIKGITYKDKNKSIVTDVDHRAEKMIIEQIRRRYPRHNIISEETGLHKGSEDVTWIIDPLDGTANYAQSIPFYCVSIAVRVKNKNVVGVIYDPVHDELFCAADKKFAYLGGKAIHVSSTKKLTDALCGFGFSKPGILSNNFKTLYPKIRKGRILGSTALALCYVACGRLDIYTVDQINDWDVVAGLYILEKAGGTFHDVAGKNVLKSNKEKIRGLVADNTILHSQIIRTIKKTGA